MEIKAEFINENELAKITTIYHDIPNNFRNSININPQIENEIKEVHNRALLNFGRSILSFFNLKYLEMFEELSKFYEYDEELFELSKSIIKIFNSYIKELNDNLLLRNENDFDELKFILGISLITLEEIVEDKDIELAYEAFFQIERSIEKEKLYLPSRRFIGSGFELNTFNDDLEIQIGQSKSDFNVVIINGL